MREVLSPEALYEAIWSFRRTAFRLEHQLTYAIPYELAVFMRHSAGGDASPMQVPELREWFKRVSERTCAGGRIERVRVIDDPLTPYQAWEAWCDRWNTDAGEVIGYVHRWRAAEVGLLPSAGPGDWWLLDDELLLILDFDDAGHLIRVERTDDPQTITAARSWRTTAITHSMPTAPRAAAG